MGTWQPVQLAVPNRSMIEIDACWSPEAANTVSRSSSILLLKVIVTSAGTLLPFALAVVSRTV